VILQVAKDLFYEKSFAAVGVDEIGARAGVTGPAIYRHFSGKDEILATLFDDALEALSEATAATSSDPFVELEGLVRGHVQFVIAVGTPVARRPPHRSRYVEFHVTGCMSRGQLC